MKKTICYCDICSKEGAREYTVLARMDKGGEEGEITFRSPKIVQKKVDLCDEHALEIASHVCLDACGDVIKMEGV